MTTWTCDRCFRLVAIELTSCPWCHPPKKAEVVMPHAHSLFEEAHRLIGGDRREAYGNYTEEARSIAAMWTELLRDVLAEGKVVEARKVPLMMVALKLNRMKARAHHDSKVDVCGYAGLLAELEGGV